jgi:uncharacterized phage protein gp47/JayE
MPTYGLTATGFRAPTIDEKISDLNAKFRANIDAGLDLEADQPMGQVVGTFGADIVSVWEILATVYNAMNPNAAEGNLLVNDCALSGTRPQIATYSKVTGIMHLTAGTTVNAGAVASVVNQPTNTWVLTAPVTAVADGFYAGFFRSSLPGPFVAPAGTLLVINTPTVGWLTVGNSGDAVPGLAGDTDTTLRQKRERELTGQGSGDTDAIRAALLKMVGMIQAFVFENTTLVMDATGLPGKAFRAVVWDNNILTDEAIATVIWKAKPTGIQPYGATLWYVTDSAGNRQLVGFDRAAQKRTYVTCTVTAAAGVSIGAAERLAIRQAIKAYADKTFNLGVSIVDLPFRASALVPTLTTDVPTFAFDFTPAPVNTGNLLITGLQIATVAIADISVNGSFV